MIIVGLTGSIAMGKTETAKIFAARNIPVFDSDAAVHELYATGGAAVAPIAALCPAAIVGNAVDREKLATAIRKDPDLLAKIELAVHPLVREKQAAFLRTARSAGAGIVVLDIPLLFETGREHDVDKIVVVSASSELQRQRALKRPGMTPEKLDFILSKQVPDEEKRARADFVVDTSLDLEHSNEQIGRIIERIGRHKDDKGNHTRHRNDRA